MDRLIEILQQLDFQALSIQTGRIGCPFASPYGNFLSTSKEVHACLERCGVLYKEDGLNIYDDCPCNILDKKYVKEKFWTELVKARSEI